MPSTNSSKDQNRQYLANLWQEKRKALDLTQREQAHLMGVSQQTISHWETNVAPIPEMAWRLLKYMERNTKHDSTPMQKRRLLLLDRLMPLVLDLLDGYR